jgi:8-oxo-dGTP diphosphatase
LVVAGIITDSFGRILLAQRPPGKRLAGLWEFPGGKVEPGESEESALHRELQEELGLRVRLVENLGHFPYTYDWGNLILSVFVVNPLNEPRPSADVQVFRWEKRDAVMSAQLTPADIQPWRHFLGRFETTD